MSEAIAPSIPGELAPGKDPPFASGEENRKDGGIPADGGGDADKIAMPPPPNPRRSGSTNADYPPRSPNILLTQPTFTGSSSQNQTPQTPSQPRYQGDMLVEGLAGTQGTVKERPPFAPFFTLVSDAATRSTYHPSQVHYLFSDDDASEVLTGALVRCCGAEHLLGEEGDTRLRQSAEGEVSSSSGMAPPVVKKEKRRSGEKEKPSRRPQKEREERVVIVDVNDTGDGIKGVWSANPSWAVLGAEIANAPTWDGAEPEDGGPERGLMLRIEGVGVGDTIADEGGKEARGKRDEGRRESADGGSGVWGEEEMQSLLDGFDKKMSILRRIVASGEEFRRAKEEPLQTEKRRVDSHNGASVHDPMADSGS